jgi:hypothetical protein
MSTVYFPQLSTVGISMGQRPYTTSSDFLHVNNDMQCGVRYSHSYRTNPLTKFSINFPSITDTEVAILESFFVSQNGKFGQWVFLDPVGNLVPNSETFSDGSTDPFGGHRAGRITSQTQTVLAGDGGGITLCASMWVKPDSASPTTYTIGITGATTTVTLTTTSWTRIQHAGTVSGSSGVSAIYSGPSSVCFGFSCVAFGAAGSYAKTPGRGYGYHPNCRFSEDDFIVKQIGINQSSVSLPCVEVGF